jgi:hypothetical protein
MTAVQDWLRIGPLTPQNVFDFAWGLMRTGDEQVEVRYDEPRVRPSLPLTTPGIERC